MDIGGSLTPEENAFFESGGESPIPTDTGTDNTGNSDNTGNGSPPAGDKPTDQGSKAPQHVPLAALQEERSKRKALGDTVKGLETQLAELRGKFSIIDRLGKPDGGEGEAAKGPPKPEDDIFGAVNAITKRLDDADKAKVDADKAAADRNTFVTSYRNDAAKFEQANPDYKQAYNISCCKPGRPNCRRSGMTIRKRCMMRSWPMSTPLHSWRFRRARARRKSSMGWRNSAGTRLRRATSPAQMLIPTPLPLRLNGSRISSAVRMQIRA
jgi:hypothetical protein